MEKMHETQHDLALECSGPEDEEDAKWAVDRACNFVNEGKFEKALSLLGKAERICPNVKGLSEIVAVTEVCFAAAWTPCYCSAKSEQQKSPDWYRILKVDEKADINVIKKRYRQLALLLHPDKNKHVRAEEAFKLVSEAYAQLSDKHRRTVFNLERLKRHCKKCSSKRANIQSLPKGYRERLKGYRSSSQRGYFDTEMHRAEWKMEHEKLQMFRERARARVDSIAQVLRERRSRWNEEATREKHQTKTVSRKTSAFNEASEEQFRGKNDFLHQLYHHIRPTKEKSQQSGSSSSQTAHANFSQSTEESESTSVVHDLVELLNGRRAQPREKPHVLQSLDGLLGMLREEIGGNASSLKGDQMQAGRKPNNETKAEVLSASDSKNRAVEDESANSKNSKCGLPRVIKDAAKNADNFDEESTVINDFLAGLGWSPTQERPISNDSEKSPVQEVPSSSPQGRLSAQTLRNLKTPRSREQSSTTATVKCGSPVQTSPSRSQHTKGLNNVPTSRHKESDDSCQHSSPDTRASGSRKILRDCSVQKKEFMNLRVSSNDSADTNLSNVQQGVGVTTSSSSFVRIHQSKPSTSLNSSLEFTSNSGTDHIIRIQSLASKVYTKATSLLDQKMSTRTLFSAEGTSSETSNKKTLNESRVSKTFMERCFLNKDTTNVDQTILQTQSQKSEQLLKTLERLREETRSVASTLEKIKTNVGPEIKHVGGIFHNNCHVPSASMVVT